MPPTSAADLVTDDAIMKCHHLLHLFHSCIVPAGPKDEQRQRGGLPGPSGDWALKIPCATELREARVKFVKKNANTTTTAEEEKKKTTFMDISFHRPCPLDFGSFWSSRLEIPEIRIDDDTDTLFRNLIAFEQCCSEATDHVSAYAYFMDALIDSDEDVALLRQRGIVVSGLGSDKDVAELFNQLCKEVTVDQVTYLDDTMCVVKKHCEGSWNKCWASLKRTYFSHPWLLLSVIGAVILFVLTLLQTIYSILSYEKQS